MNTFAIFVGSLVAALACGRYLRYRREQDLERDCRLLWRAAQRYETIMEQEKN